MKNMLLAVDKATWRRVNRTASVFRCCSYPSETNKLIQMMVCTDNRKHRCELGNLKVRNAWSMRLSYSPLWDRIILIFLGLAGLAGRCEPETAEVADLNRLLHALPGLGIVHSFSAAAFRTPSHQMPRGDVKGCSHSPALKCPVDGKIVKKQGIGGSTQYRHAYVQ